MVIPLLSIKGAVFIAKSASPKLLAIIATKYGIEAQISWTDSTI